MKKDLSIMIKPASSACNMRCEYCFYHSLAQSRKDESFGTMTQHTAENLIRQALEFSDGGSIYFTFQGGEPLIAGKDFFSQFVSTVNKYNMKGSPIYYGLQTNGTLIDSEWADFFATNNFLLGLSLDGDENANRFRVDANMNNTFSKVKEAMDLLNKRGLRPFGDKSVSPLYMDVDQYTSFLIKLFKLYAKDYANGEYISLRQFDNYVRLFLGQNAEQCGMNGYCSRQFVVEGNGNVYPCDFYCLDEWLLGNVNADSFEQIASNPKAYKFMRDSFQVDKQCQECEYYRLCRGGGCKRAKEDNDYCLAYKRFFKECLPLFKLFINARG